ncbi:MAG: hypothetical protein E7007_02465 [Alphaproteobacteria bacterium]|nr:hypothetical protein [Alphaproteobacteria bacterium]
MGLTPYKPESDRPLSMTTGYLARIFFQLQRCHAELTQAIEILQESEPWFDHDENTSKKPGKAGK